MSIRGPGGLDSWKNISGFCPLSTSTELPKFSLLALKSQKRQKRWTLRAHWPVTNLIVRYPSTRIDGHRLRKISPSLAKICYTSLSYSVSLIPKRVFECVPLCHKTNVPNVHKRSHRISGQTLLLFNHWERTKLFVYKCTKYNNKQNNSIRFNHITFVSCLIYNFLLYTCRVQGLISWLMTIAAVGFCLMKIRGFQIQLNFFVSRTGCGIQRRQNPP